MTEEKQNIAIYKLLGYQPVKSWKFYHDKEKTRASLCFRTKRDALEWIEREKNSWPYTQFSQEYEFSEPEEYEDWSYCPQVDLNLIHKAECDLSFEQHDFFRERLAKLVEFNGLCPRGAREYVSAGIKQRREALLKTLNLWEE